MAEALLGGVGDYLFKVAYARKFSNLRLYLCRSVSTVGGVEEASNTAMKMGDSSDLEYSIAKLRGQLVR